MWSQIHGVQRMQAQCALELDSREECACESCSYTVAVALGGVEEKGHLETIHMHTHTFVP